MFQMLGAIFEGIGKTFEAGSKVNIAQISERMQKKQLEYNREELAAMTQQGRLDYLLQANNQENTIIKIVIIAAILIVALFIIFRH